MKAPLVVLCSLMVGLLFVLAVLSDGLAVWYLLPLLGAAVHVDLWLGRERGRWRCAPPGPRGAVLFGLLGWLAPSAVLLLAGPILFVSMPEAWRAIAAPAGLLPIWSMIAGLLFGVLGYGLGALSGRARVAVGGSRAR